MGCPMLNRFVPDGHACGMRRPPDVTNDGAAARRTDRLRGRVLKLRESTQPGGMAMNGTIAFGVALVAAGLYLNGIGLVPMLVLGVAVIAYGAFAPSKAWSPSGPKRLPSDAEPWV